MVIREVWRDGWGGWDGMVEWNGEKKRLWRRMAWYSLVTHACMQLYETKLANKLQADNLCPVLICERQGLNSFKNKKLYDLTKYVATYQKFISSLTSSDRITESPSVNSTARFSLCAGGTVFSLSPRSAP